MKTVTAIVALLALSACGSNPANHTALDKCSWHTGQAAVACEAQENAVPQTAERHSAPLPRQTITPPPQVARAEPPAPRIVAPPEQANVSIITPKEPAVACWHRDDVADVLKAGKIDGTDVRGAVGRLAKVMSKKVDEGKCEAVPPGDLALFQATDENMRSSWSGIVHIYMRDDGEDLYAYAPQWRRAW